MAKPSEFVAILNDMCNNHSVYIGTGNGELLESLTIRDIYKMEKLYGDNPPKRMRQVMTFIGKCYEAGYDMSKARAGDCSGIIVYALRELGLIKSDMRARDLQRKCTQIDLQLLMVGDLVFDKYSEATHVGVYAGDGMVIESRGRDYGVVKRKLSAGKWVAGGRLPYFEYEVVFTRNLKYVKGDLMHGDDVLELQVALSARDYYSDKFDGTYGPKTEAAVKAYQKDNNLTADGIAGSHTITSLGFTYIK